MSPRLCRLLLLVTATLSPCAPVHGSAPAACQASNADLVAAVRSLHDSQHNVGVQAAIRLHGRVVFSEALGFADRERGIRVTRATIFPLASLAKAYTGIAALRAVAAGRLDLDQPIQTYVPEFPVKPEVVITPRRLAAHRAGIRHWGAERAALFSRHFDRLDQILPLFANDPLLAGAGSQYQYSSYGYNLLALAVERATGVAFTTYVTREILEPLGLRQTRFEDARRPRHGMTRLYSIYDPTTYEERPLPAGLVPARDYSHNMAAGNMSATAEDVTRFGAALLRPGLLPAAQYDLLLTRPTFDGVSSPMSFGFFAPAPGRERLLSISGSNPGVQTGLVLFPERDLAVAVLANTWGTGSRSGDLVVRLPVVLADLCAPHPR